MTTVSIAQQAFDTEAENARFMTRVYGWMTLGLCVSGVIAWFMGQDPDLVRSIYQNKAIFWVLVIAQLGAVVTLSMLIHKINALTAMAIYLAYAALTGVTLSVIFLVYTIA